MYGKFFSSTFTGSMLGAGPTVFAVWGYVIANTIDSQVELNPKLLAPIIGTSEADVQTAIAYLEAADLSSRTPDDDGRRIVREGQFAYRVVNHSKYKEIKSEAERREYMRVYMQNRRKKESEELALLTVNDVNSKLGKPVNSLPLTSASVYDSSSMKPLTLTSNNHKSLQLAEFSRLYSLYPRKIKRADAEKNFLKQVKYPDEIPLIESAISNYIKEIAILGKGDQFIMHASTFFNNVWRDYIDGTWQEPSASPTKPKEHDVFKQYRE